MDQTSFGTELFIDEVQRRPAILCDIESTEYKNRITKKKRSWDELFELFADPEDTIEKKKNLGKCQLFISILFHMNSMPRGEVNMNVTEVSIIKF